MNPAGQATLYPPSAPTGSVHGATPENSAEAARVAPGDIAVGVVIGRASEYFDFFVYGIASVLVFPAVFFPFASRLDGTLYAFALLALAFVVRPIGTLARHGHPAPLRPQRQADGLAVPAGKLDLRHGAAARLRRRRRHRDLVAGLCRIGQGLALGGSWDGLPSLLALNAPEERRGWYAMLGQLGAPLGFLVACGVFAYLWGNLATHRLPDLGLALSLLRRLRHQRGGAVRPPAPGGHARVRAATCRPTNWSPAGVRELFRLRRATTWSSAPSPRSPPTRCSTWSRSSRCRG
jgi:hypothetical protein